MRLLHDLKFAWDFLLRSHRIDGFWTAVGAIGTVVGATGAIVTLIFIYRQITQAKEQLAHTKEQITFTKEVASYELLRKEDDRFNSEEMQRERSNLAKTIMIYPENYKKIDEYADSITSYFVDLGLMMKRGLAQDYVVWSMSSWYILRYWKVLEKYINWVRESYADTTYYCDFDYLYHQMLEYEKRMTKKEKIEISADEIDKFLWDELHVEVRHFVLSDLDQIMIIEKLSYSESEAYSRSQFEELYRDHPEGFFVAEIVGEIVGYIIGYITDEIGEIDSIAVAPIYRHLGIGQKLMEIILNGFRERNTKICSLEVRITNVIAISFHKKLGFQIERTIENYYEDGADAYIMRMEIQ